MPQGRARRYTHLIDLQGEVSTGQTQIKSRVQLTCNNIKVTTLEHKVKPELWNWIQHRCKFKNQFKCNKMVGSTHAQTQANMKQDQVRLQQMIKLNGPYCHRSRLCTQQMQRPKSSMNKDSKPTKLHAHGSYKLQRPKPTWYCSISKTQECITMTQFQTI